VVALKQDEMRRLAEKAVNLAQRRRADEAEAYVYQGLTTNVNIKRGQINESSRIIDRGLGIRAIMNKAIGFSYTNMLENEDVIEETVLKALNSARASKPDKDWHGLPTKKTFSSVTGTYDNKIVELNSEDLVKTLLQC